ncbi:hypothetical protein [Candidatus Chlamydia sanziniae]|uniref:Uncharacterized protein n=1 Tax=Candidatus Chlamydia sanziniae TaxID=1806891 RepID=A0A1A9HTE8_9CHLA|nr:hypothetical protein [Candidatus Chlamydia sanziniae]ANH78268.1 hypothetical protein Cs308_0097 [Candidatus Chlamydia sanziniae]
MVIQTATPLLSRLNPVLVEQNIVNRKLACKRLIADCFTVIFAILSCLVFLAVLVLYPHIVLWVGIVSICGGILLLSLAILASMYALSLKKLEVKFEKPQWTEEKDILGDSVWKRELAEVFLRGYLSKDLAVYHREGTLDAHASLANIMCLNSLQPCLDLLKQKRIYTNILLHIARQLISQICFISINKRNKKLGEQLLYRLMELCYPAPELLVLIHHVRIFDTEDSSLLKYAKQGKFSIREDNTFCYEFMETQAPVAETWAALEHLFSLENPDILFQKDSFLSYVCDFYFIKDFLYQHFKHLIQRDPGHCLARGINFEVEKLEKFLACCRLRMELVYDMVLHWGHHIPEGAECYTTMNQKWVQLFIQFSAAIKALKRLIHNNLIERTTWKALTKFISHYNKILETKERFVRGMSFHFHTNDFVVLLDVLDLTRGGRIPRDSQEDYHLCFQAVDALLCWFSSRIRQGKMPYIPHDNSSVSLWRQRLFHLARQGLSLKALKTLIRLLNFNKLVWEDILPPLENLLFYEDLRNFIQS